MKKILLIGKRSFIANNIYENLKDYFFLKKVSYLEFIKTPKNKIIKYEYIINCSLSKKYVENKYSELNDFDLKIAKKISTTSLKMIMLSSRKVYQSGNNIKETSKLNSKCNYSKNKILTEDKIYKILKNRILILRLSNLIGRIDLNKSKRKIHYTFLDNFFLNIKKDIIFDNKNIYKDFLSTKKFCEILRKLLKTKAYGVFNISIGKKIFLRDLITWLNFYNDKKNLKIYKTPVNFKKDCFYLNNSKLKKKINIDISIMELKKYCINISKNFFKKNKSI